MKGPAIFEPSDWHLLYIDGGSLSAVFSRVDDRALRDAPFLDGRSGIRLADPVSLPLESLLDPWPGHPLPLAGWIAHTGHCGSTLLARLLDVGSNRVLREPQPLAELARMRRALFGSGEPSMRWRALVAGVVRTLGRPSLAGGRTIIKATSMCANLLADLPEGVPVLHLGAPLDAHLARMIRAGVPYLKRDLRWIPVEARWTGLSVPETDDPALQHAALWMLRSAFSRRREHQGEVRWLNSMALLEQGSEVVRSVADWFELDLADASGLLATHAKTGEPWSPSQERQRRAQELVRAEEACSNARQWLMCWAAEELSQIELRLSPPCP